MGLLTVAMTLMLIFFFQLVIMEKIDTMNDEIRAKLQAIRANQAATASAVDNMTGDIHSQSAKIDALKEELAKAVISAEAQALLDELVTGSEALKARAEAAAGIVAEAPDTGADA